MILENDELKKELEEIAGVSAVLINEPLKAHTTFRIGGPADYLVIPETSQVLRDCILCCKKHGVAFDIIGNGSNILAGDLGYRGVIFQLYKTLENVSFEKDKDGVIIRAGAGIMLGRLANMAAAKGLGGMEFAAGIPGTLGGAVFMNAGAYGGEMKQILVSAKVLDENMQEMELSCEELELGYRTSIIQKKSYVVIEAAIRLSHGDKEIIEDTMKELSRKRRDKQPLEYPSAGSTFKRPEGYFAGKLIQDAGLKGYRVGDAMVSEKHSGFVVNVGEATAKDVVTLMEDVNNKVLEQFGVPMTPEVRRLGEF